MSAEDLMRMLDLAGTDAGPSAELSVQDSAAVAPAAPPSEHCLDLDEWDCDRGQQLAAKSPKLRELKTTEHAAADFFGAAFKIEPSLNAACTDPRRHDFMKSLMESSDFQALRASTTLNDLASEIAAHSFADNFAGLQKEDAKREAKERADAKAGKPSNPMAGEMAAMRAAGAAVKQAAEEVEELENAQQAFGLGGDGGTDGKMDPQRVAKLYKAVRGNAQLRRIVELAGRFRRLARSKQRQKSTHGYDDMVGVELGGDVGRLLPQELAMLADEDFELDAMRRLVERQSMQREYRGIERVAKGPIIVCVDESGSMSGEPVAAAKAFALAMAWIARHQNRWCALVSYSGGTDGVVLALPPGRWDEAAVCDWLTHFSGGGTTMDVPLDELPRTYWPDLVAKGLQRGKTDVICITDAIVNVPDDMRERFLRWKAAEKVRMLSLIINGEPGDLAAVSDEVFRVSGIDVGEDAIGKCLSV